MSQIVVSVRGILPDYSATGQVFQKMAPYVYRSGSQVTGPPLAIYYDEGYKEKDVDAEVAFPIAKMYHPKVNSNARNYPVTTRWRRRFTRATITLS